MTTQRPARELAARSLSPPRERAPQDRARYARSRRLAAGVCLWAIVLAAATLCPQAAAQSETPYGRSPASTTDASKRVDSKGREAQAPRERRGRGERRPPNAVTQPEGIQKLSKEAPASRGGGAAAGPQNVPAIVFPSNAVRASLFFLPLDVKVPAEESFTLDLMLNNQTGMRPDGFDVSIAYDPQRLAFEGYDAARLAPYLADPTRDFSVKRELGRLDLSARLVGVPTDNRLPLVTLAFVARQTLGRTALRFLTPPDGAAAVYSKGINIVGRQEQALGGVLDALVFVEPAPEPASDLAAESASALPSFEQSGLGDAAETGWGAMPADARPEAPAWIGLQGPEKTDLTQGGDFWVDLVIYNPEQAPIESIGVAASFDRKVLQVIDEDRDNWISDGVNIWDGAFHDNYAFDFHGSNRADNARGRIYYSMARHAGSCIFPTGVFARIHFRAVAPARLTTVALLTKSEGPVRQSYVRAYGTDRQIVAGERPDAATRVSLSVAPASAGVQGSKGRVDVNLE